MRIKNKTAMQAFANQLATYLKAQDVLLLDGDLGAWKNNFKSIYRTGVRCKTSYQFTDF